MELKWKTTFSKTKLLDFNDSLICVFDLQDSRSIILNNYQISPNGFYSYHIRDNTDNIFQLHIDTTKLNLSVDSSNYEFVYESRQHYYIQSHNVIIASCYQDYGLFNSKGTITINSGIKHWPVFAYALLQLRQAAINTGSE